MNEVVRDVESLVEKACKSKNNIFGYGIWSHHIIDVVKWSLKLADYYQANREIVQLGALLHDYAGIKNCKDEPLHHIAGAREAAEILKGYSYPQEIIEKIQACVLNHRSSVNNPKATIEEQIVASADAIAHMTQLASLFQVAYIHMGKTTDQAREWVKGKIQRDWNKLCKYGRELMADHYSSIMLLLKD